MSLNIQRFIVIKVCVCEMFSFLKKSPIVDNSCGKDPGFCGFCQIKSSDKIVNASNVGKIDYHSQEVKQKNKEEFLDEILGRKDN